MIPQLWRLQVIVIGSQCEQCVHLVRGEDGTFELRCSAFPAGIPPEIITGDPFGEGEPHDHRLPFPGDHGVRFAALPGKHHPLDGFPR